MIRVLIVDDEALIRSGLRALLDTEPDITVIGEAANGRDAVTFARKLAPDVILMDIQMPVANGLEATRQIATDETLASTRVIITTSFPTRPSVVEALRAGASGFLVKDIATEELVQAVRHVAGGGALVSPSVTHHLISDIRARPSHKLPDADLAELLTVREREVLSLVAVGMSNREIAEHLFITPATAKTHVGRVLGKVGLRNRAQLVSLAYEAGLAAPARTNRMDGSATSV
jgi:DNA-binding NarL/FixJ family response regulator